MFFLHQNPEQSQYVVPVVEGTDYAKLAPPPLRTRNSTDICNCYLCNKGRDTLIPGGVPKSTPKAPPMKICAECKGELAPGVRHICTRDERNQNIVELFKSGSEKSRRQILSQTLKGISISTKQGGVVLIKLKWVIRGQGTQDTYFQHFSFKISEMKRDQIMLPFRLEAPHYQ